MESPPVDVTTDDAPPATARHAVREIERELRDTFNNHHEAPQLSWCIHHDTGNVHVDVTFEDVLTPRDVEKALDRIDNGWEYDGLLAMGNGAAEVHLYYRQ